MIQTPLIVGAGFTGLLAAHAWPNAKILEAAASPQGTHKALMRFRTDAVSSLTGIPFRKVHVKKGIFSNGEFTQPNVKVANQYAQKVIGKVVDRSIWDISPADRYVAPPDFYEQLVDAVGDRIEWGHRFDPALEWECPVINTAPLSIILKQLRVPFASDFRRAPVRVRRWRVPNADVYQTVYFPDPDTPIYRASITGDLLIVEESVNGYDKPESMPLYYVGAAFGLDTNALEPLDDTQQQFGKVDSLPARQRKDILFALTQTYNLYSLGRFATWRNILLDDVVQDIHVIKRLLKSGTAYDARKAAL